MDFPRFVGETHLEPPSEGPSVWNQKKRGTKKVKKILSSGEEVEGKLRIFSNL